MRKQWHWHPEVTRADLPDVLGFYDFERLMVKAVLSAQMSEVCQTGSHPGLSRTNNQVRELVFAYRSDRLFVMFTIIDYQEMILGLHLGRCKEMSECPPLNARRMAAARLRSSLL